MDANTAAEPPADARPRLLQRPAVQWALRLLLLWLSIEIPACLSGSLLEAHGFLYTVKDMSRFPAYAERRHPVLGWERPSKESLDASMLDATGGRRLPAFPDTRTPACVTLYGDSFAWGAEVADEHTWGNFLARKLQCRVGIYGVPGYGTDQAYLRYLHRPEDTAKVALLGIFTNDVPRNVNRYRALLVTGMTFGLKPRFVLDERGELKLLPVPLPDEAGIRAIAESGGAELEEESFKLGTPDALTRWTFPYSLSLLRLLASRRTHQVVTHTPQYAPFFAPDHPSRAVPITAAIARAFVREAARRGAFGGVVLIPAWDDLAEHRKTGRWITRSLIDALAEAKIPTLNAAADLAEPAPSDDYCSLYTKCDGGHLTPVGNRRLAESVHKWLADMGKQ